MVPCMTQKGQKANYPTDIRVIFMLFFLPWPMCILKRGGLVSKWMRVLFGCLLFFFFYFAINPGNRNESEKNEMTIWGKSKRALPKRSVCLGVVINPTGIL